MASDTDLWCFIWWQPKQNVVNKISIDLWSQPPLRPCCVTVMYRVLQEMLFIFLRTEASEARYRPGRQLGQQGRVSYIKTFFPCIINPIIIIRRCWYLIILIVCRPLKMELCIGKRKSNCGWGHVIVWNRIIMWLNGFDICIKRFQCCYW